MLNSPEYFYDIIISILI